MPGGETCHKPRFRLIGEASQPQRIISTWRLMSGRLGGKGGSVGPSQSCGAIARWAGHEAPVYRPILWSRRLGGRVSRRLLDASTQAKAAQNETRSTPKTVNQC